jgi:hypothetical protein
MHLSTGRPGARNSAGYGLGGRKTPGSEGEPEAKAGMSLKGKDMPKCDRPINDLRQGGGRRFRAEGRWRNKPKRVNLGCSDQIQGIWLPNELSWQGVARGWP